MQSKSSEFATAATPTANLLEDKRPREPALAARTASPVRQSDLGSKFAFLAALFSACSLPRHAGRRIPNSHRHPILLAALFIYSFGRGIYDCNVMPVLCDVVKEDQRSTAYKPRQLRGNLRRRSRRHPPRRGRYHPSQRRAAGKNSDAFPIDHSHGLKSVTPMSS